MGSCGCAGHKARGSRGRVAGTPKTPIPAELALCGVCCLETGPTVTSVAYPVGTGCRHTLRRFLASISTYVSGNCHSLPNPGVGLFRPASEPVALSTGCDRAHLWKSETNERDFPVSRSQLGRFRPSHRLFPTASPILADRIPVHLTGESTASCEAFSLPASRGLPMSLHRCACSAGHSRVRYVLCGLLGPLQAAFAPCDISLPGLLPSPASPES